MDRRTFAKSIVLGLLGAMTAPYGLLASEGRPATVAQFMPDLLRPCIEAGLSMEETLAALNEVLNDILAGATMPGLCVVPAAVSFKVAPIRRRDSV